MHAGLICLNGPIGMDLDMQIELFQAALDALDEDDDLINRVLEVTLADSSEAELDIVRYALPAD
ncbi:MAG TPA: hypothetical protein VJX94_26315 [Stellaceae bacterium]|nr:hypothetical protein [Stellaceae bacterium]